MIARGRPGLAPAFAEAWRILRENFVALYAICAAPALLSVVSALLMNPVMPQAFTNATDPRQALQTFAAAMSKVVLSFVGFLVTFFVSWGLWVAAMRRLSAGTPITASALWRDAPWVRCLMTGFAFLLVPFVGFFVAIGYLILTAMIGGIGSVLGPWVAGPLFFVFFSVWIAAGFWATGLIWLASPVLIFSEASGYEAFLVALRKARAFAVSLIGVVVIMALAIALLGFLILVGFLALHPEILQLATSSTGLSTGLSKGAPDPKTLEAMSRAFGSLTKIGPLHIFYWLAFPILSAYASAVFVAWFAGTEPAPSTGPSVPHA